MSGSQEKVISTSSSSIEVSSRNTMNSSGENTGSEKPPVVLSDKRLMIQYEKGNPNIVVENTQMSSVVYVLECTDCRLTVKGKINSIILDSCTKTSVLFDTLISGIEFINCKSCEMQVLGKVKTISINNTDGCQIYLNKDTLDVEITSSKSSEMNVQVPNDKDFTEYPIPEQFKTTILAKGGLKTIQK